MIRAIAPSHAVTQAWIGLMRAQRVLLAAIESDLKAAGLPPLAWYDVLLELKRAERGRLRPYEIEDRALLEQHNLSRLLDRMEKRGVVRREVHPDDARGRWVCLTPSGRALQSEMWKVYGAAIQCHLGSRLDEARAAQLAALLENLYRGA